MYHIGGNQRELARQKNQKKQQECSKRKPSGGDGLTLEQRKFRYKVLDWIFCGWPKFWSSLFLVGYRDAELMREKQRKKEEQAKTTSEKQ